MTEYDEYDEYDEWECGCECCTRARTLRDEYEDSNRRELLAGIDVVGFWHSRRVALTTAEWCAVWRKSDRRPELVGPVQLYRGGGTAHSMSWTRSPGVALAFANHRYGTTWQYANVLGPVRLPVWSCVFPPEAVLAVLEAEQEYVIDIERFPPRNAARYEPTDEDVAAYREFCAPLLPDLYRP